MITIGANIAGGALAVTLASRSERANENNGVMLVQDAAAEAQSTGLKAQHTMLDQLLDRPSPLDRFAD